MSAENPPTGGYRRVNAADIYLPPSAGDAATDVDSTAEEAKVAEQLARAEAKLAAVASEVGENNCWCEDEDVLCVHCRVRAALTAGPHTWPQCGHTDCDCPIEPGWCENCGNQMRDHVQADGLLSCYPRSAGSPASPVTAGVPDTDACGCVEGYEWRARQDAVCGSCPRRGETPAGVPTTAAWRALAADWTQDSGAIRNALEDAWDALDAARGELVTARGERDALRVELAGVTPEGVEWQYRPWIPPAQRTADDWSSMVAVARNRAWAAEAERDEAVRLQALEKSAADSMARKVNELRGELAAANARIAAVEALCDQWEYDTNADTAVAQLRSALGVPTAGEAGTAHG